MWHAGTYGVWVACGKICEWYFWLLNRPGTRYQPWRQSARYMFDIRASTVVPGTVESTEMPDTGKCPMHSMKATVLPASYGTRRPGYQWVPFRPKTICVDRYGIALPSVLTVLGRSFHSLVSCNYYDIYCVSTTRLIMHSQSWRFILRRIKFLSFIIRARAFDWLFGATTIQSCEAVDYLIQLLLENFLLYAYIILL